MTVLSVTAPMKRISEPGGSRRNPPCFGKEDVRVAVVLGPEPPHTTGHRGIVGLQLPDEAEDPGVVPVLAAIRPLDGNNSCTGVHGLGQDEEVLQQCVKQPPVATQLISDAVAGNIDVLKLRTARAGDRGPQHDRGRKALGLLHEVQQGLLHLGAGCIVLLCNAHDQHVCRGSGAQAALFRAAVLDHHVLLALDVFVLKQ